MSAWVKSSKNSVLIVGKLILSWDTHKALMNEQFIQTTLIRGGIQLLDFSLMLHGFVNDNSQFRTYTCLCARSHFLGTQKKDIAMTLSELKWKVHFFLISKIRLYRKSPMLSLVGFFPGWGSRTKSNSC